MTQIDTKELIKLGAIVGSLLETEIAIKEFPTLQAWLSQIDQEKINEVIAEETLKIDLNQSMTITRDQFLSLYMHTVALLGVEEFNHRFPGLRLLLLNTCSQDELNAVLMQIEQIKKNFMEF